MSIIYDALKKAECERAPMSSRLSMYRAASATGRRWHRSVIASWLIGTTVLGGAGAWLWLESWGAFPPVMSTRHMVSSSVLASADDAPGAPMVDESTIAAPIHGAVLPFQAKELAFVAPVESSTNAESAFAKARAAEADGRWDAAMQHYRQAIAWSPKLLEARNNLGNLFIHRGEIAAAIAEFQAALMIDAGYVLARNNLGSAYLLQGEEALAIQEFLAALHTDGTYVSPYYNLALLYARRRDVGQSIAFLTKALALEPKVLSWVQDDSDFDSIRGAPEFQRLRVQKQARP